MAEEKKYLDYDGLAHLVEKLNNKIEASGSGGSSDPATGVWVFTDEDGGEPRVKTLDSYDGDGCCIPVLAAHGRCLAVRVTNNSMEWCPDDIIAFTDSGGVMTKSDYYAIQDFRGEYNTDKMRDYILVNPNLGDEGTGGNIMYKVAYMQETDKIPGRSWYVPGAGELWLILQNINAINEVLAKNKATEIVADRLYWSSTQCDDNHAWALAYQSGNPYFPKITSYEKLSYGTGLAYAIYVAEMAFVNPV